MDQFWVEVAKQIPNLAALIYLVISQLRNTRDIAQDTAKTFQAIVENNKQFQVDLVKDTNGLITANSAALIENTRMLGRSIQVIEQNTKVAKLVTETH